MSAEEFVMRNPVHVWYNDYFKEMSVDVLLPNLRFKNKNIVFIFKHPVKVKVNEKFEYKTEQILENLSLIGTIYCKDNKLTCKIYEEELEDGLKVNIKYNDNVTIHRGEIQKFARAIEAKLLGIDIMDDGDSDFDDLPQEYNFLEKQYEYCDNYSISDESCIEYEESYDTFEEQYDDYPI